MLPAGEFTGSSVCVRGKPSIDNLHDWSNGAFGELVDEVQAYSHGLCLRLSLLEAYYLAFELQRLSVHSGSSMVGERDAGLSQSTDVRADSTAGGGGGASGGESPKLQTTGLLKEDCWHTFCAASSNFPHRYAVYRSLRRAGWVIRTGLKYGTDFALYAPADSPAGHAMLSALVASSDAPMDHSWSWLQQHVRLCHGVAKGAHYQSTLCRRRCLRRCT